MMIMNSALIVDVQRQENTYLLLYFHILYLHYSTFCIELKVTIYLQRKDRDHRPIISHLLAQEISISIHSVEINYPFPKPSSCAAICGSRGGAL